MLMIFLGMVAHYKLIGGQSAECKTLVTVLDRAQP